VCLSRTNKQNFTLILHLISRVFSVCVRQEVNKNAIFIHISATKSFDVGDYMSHDHNTCNIFPQLSEIRLVRSINIAFHKKRIVGRNVALQKNKDCCSIKILLKNN